MRRIALFSLALLPALAYGQASTAAGAQAAAPAADLQARVTAPAAFNRTAPNSTVSVANHPLKNIVTLKVEPKLNKDALSQAGTISYTLSLGDSTSTSPVLTHVVNVGVSDLASNSADVTVHMTVDQRGVPTNLKVSHSAGTELDSKTLAAVSQYRFKPATYDRQPVDSDVTVDVKVVK